MKTFKRAIALLLLITVVMLPVTGLCDTGFETLKMLMELETDAVPPATGTSIYGDVDEDTSRGVLSMIMFGEDSMSIMNSGINANNKYEIVMYNDLSIVQMLYYCYLISSVYSLVQAGVPAGESFIIFVSYGDDMILISDETKAKDFAETVMSTISSLAGN